MATRTAKLYSGEDKNPVVDYSDLVIWEESEFGTRAWQGEGNSSSIVIRDPLGETGNPISLPAGLSFKTLPSKSLFVIQVGSDFLYRGRVGIKNYTRDGQHVERYRQAETQLHDTNWDLDHIFVHNFVRPAETDVARVQGLIAAYLSGNGRPTTHINGSNYISGSNTVALVAQTYYRTTPLGILREIGETANKQFFITGDTIGGGSLFWDGNDSTAYACAFTISDRESEVRANPGTYWPPIWNVGPASTEDGSEQIDEVNLFYGTGETQYVTAHDTVVHAQYGHSAEIITDDTAATAAVALARANSILAHRQYEDKTYNVTIGPLTDAQVVQIEHGQTINIKARAITDADDQFRLMRIAQCRFTTPIAGTWFAHLQLGRPWKMQPYSTGPTLIPKPAAPTTPGTPATGLVEWTWSNGPLTGGGFGNYNQAVIAYPAISQSAFTMTNGLNNRLDNFRSVASGDFIPQNGGDKYLPCTVGTPINFAADVGPRNLGSVETRVCKIRYHVTPGGAQVGADVTLVNDTGSGFTHTSATLNPPATATAWRIFINGRIDNVVATTGTAIPASNPLSGTEEDCFARCDHTHAVISSVAPTPTDDEPAGFPPGTIWVEEGTGIVHVLVVGTGGAAEWVPVVASHEAIPDAHLQANLSATVAPTVNDDTTEGYGVGSIWVNTTADTVYVATDVTDGAAVWSLVSGGATTTVTDHGSMGAAETFDFGDGSDHEGVLDANLTVTLTGATTGEAAWLTLKLTQDSGGTNTLTLPASVANKAAIEAAFDTAADAVNVLTLFTYDGGTIWYGFLAGGGSVVASLDDLSDVTITSPADEQSLMYNGTAWVNTSAIWRPLMDGAGAVITDGGTGEAIMALS